MLCAGEKHYGGMKEERQPILLVKIFGLTSIICMNLHKLYTDCWCDPGIRGGEMEETGLTLNG